VSLPFEANTNTMDGWGPSWCLCVYFNANIGNNIL